MSHKFPAPCNDEMGTVSRRESDEAALETGQSLSFQEHLANSLDSSSIHSGELYDFLVELKEWYQKKGWRVDHSFRGLMRRAVTMRDSLSQLAEIVRGEVLDDAAKLREAEIYRRVRMTQAKLRTMRTDMGEGEQLDDDLEEILTYIRGDNDGNT